LFGLSRRAQASSVTSSFPKSNSAVVGMLNQLSSPPLITSPSNSITVYYSTFFDDNFPLKKKITIDSSQVPGDLNDFPLLVNINDPDLSEAAQKDGDDIVFTDDQGVTQLDHEIEKYDHTAGDLTAWVRIPFLNSTEDTIIYMYYGNYTSWNK